MICAIAPAEATSVRRAKCSGSSLQKTPKRPMTVPPNTSPNEVLQTVISNKSSSIFSARTIGLPKPKAEKKTANAATADTRVSITRRHLFKIDTNSEGVCVEGDSPIFSPLRFGKTGTVPLPPPDHSTEVEGGRKRHPDCEPPRGRRLH